MASSPAFHDLFSDRPAEYARYRPTYPAALFAWLAAEAHGGALAVDVATGNGQAALGLAPHFARVQGLDASATQLAAAASAPNVEYRCAPAEDTGLPAGAADLLTAAQALHWFDQPRFFAEAARVVRPGGLVAFWCYGMARITPAVDALVDRLYAGPVDGYWEPGRRLVEQGYRDVVAPPSLLEVAGPHFEMQLDWDLGHLVGYLGTWSATKAFIRENGRDPVAEIVPELAAAWGPSGTHRAHWPLSVRAFRR